VIVFRTHGTLRGVVVSKKAPYLLRPKTDDSMVERLQIILVSMPHGLGWVASAYDGHWSSVVGHTRSLNINIHPTLTPFIAMGRLSKFQLPEFINDR